jgi:alpha-glucosidase
MKKFITLFVLLAAVTAAAKDYTLLSPDGRLQISIRTGEVLTYAVSYNGMQLVTPSEIALTLEDGTQYGPGTRFNKVVKSARNQSFQTALFKRSVVNDVCNELRFKAKGWDLVFRAYDDGAAYRFEPQKPITVRAEKASFRFADDWPAYVPYTGNGDNDGSQFYTSFESLYKHHKLSEWDRGHLVFLPITIEADNGIRICLVESDLLDYPGMFLGNDGGTPNLYGIFAEVPTELARDGHNKLQRIVRKRDDVIARDTQQLPWRGIVVATEDRQLAQSDFVYRLATPADPAKDWSWVKPGKVAWDWWNDWNLYGVDFEAGINNETYKYYIDFAAAKGIEYVILDEGWSVMGKSLLDVVPEIDLEMLSQYARSKGVDLILWAGCWPFNEDMEAVCAKYSAMGIKGWKIDFMDYDDQLMVQFYRRAAETAARYGMLCDFHGAYKPTGLNRTYPNVINFEGVYGLENLKWNQRADEVTYDVTIPFVRLVAGPADYTQGAMRNGTQANFRAVNSEPMSQGTRCHQLAEYIVFDAPLTMLCDSPSNYLQEPECTAFIASVPTVWDETIALDGKIGEYVVMARRKGHTWYVGALNGWEARDLEIDLSFLPAGVRSGVAYQDGVNAHRAARDYKKTGVMVSGKVKVHLAPGGGYALVIN